mgnify:CR=1 FL=1
MKYIRKMYESNSNITKLCEEWNRLRLECVDAQLYTGADIFKNKLSNFVEIEDM